jgi:peptidoglycan/LPS O-acetylase OafA/YrhL
MIFFKKYSFSLELFNKFYIFLIFTLILQIISFFSYKYFEMPMRKLINDKFK